MNPKDFVDLIKLAVSEAAIQDSISTISAPPGRKPKERLIEISNFYNKQDLDGKACIEEIIKQSVEEAVFGFLCVLDGVRAIENPDNRGELSLWYERDSAIKLNANGDLHDLYNQD